MFLSKEKGFTLPEIIISMFILSFILLTILGIFGSAISGIKKGENHIVAVALAQQIMETYRNDLEMDFFKYDEISSPPIELDNVSACPAEVNGVPFSADVFIDPASGPMAGGGTYSYSTDRIRKLTIILTWKEHAGGVKNFKISTFVSNLH